MKHTKLRTLATLAVASLLATIASADLVWYSPMDGNANPEPGYGPTPTAVGAPAATTNRFNEADSAVYFSGSDYYNLGKPTNSFFAATVACWIKFDSADANARGPVAVGGSKSYSTDDYFTFVRESGTAGSTAVFRSDLCIDKRRPVVGSTINIGEWHHLAMSFEIVGADTIHSFYLDGMKTTMAYVNLSTLLVPVNNWVIGAERLGDRYWIGAIDDVGVWDVALTDAEIAELAAGTKLPTEVGITLNVPPVADAGPDHYVSLPTNSVTLTATATDADGTLASNLWEQLSGPAATLSGTNTLALTVGDLVPGRYDFQFTTFDDGGAFHGDIVRLLVSDSPKLVWYSPMDGDATPSKPAYGGDPIATSGTPAPTADRNGNPDAAMLFDGDGDYYKLARETPVFLEGSVALWARLDDTSVPIQTNLVITVTTNELEEVTTTTNTTYQTLPVTARGLVAIGETTSYIRSESYFSMARSSGTETHTNMRAFFKDDSSESSRWIEATGIEVGVWNHYVSTFSCNLTNGTTDCILYINGEVADQTTYSAIHPVFPTKDWLVGAHRTYQDYWMGALDDVAVWNTALTPEQIQLLADGTRLPPDALRPLQDPTTLLIVR